jgi:hypothetical protein
MRAYHDCGAGKDLAYSIPHPQLIQAPAAVCRAAPASLLASSESFGKSPTEGFSKFPDSQLNLCGLLAFLD